MATVIQRKSNFSVVYSYMEDDVRKQKWDSCSSRKEANIRKAFIEYYQKENGSVLVPLAEQLKEEREIAQLDKQNPTEEITLSAFLEKFVLIYGTSKWAVSTYSNKLSTINNYINPYLGDLKLSQLTTQRLSEYYISLLKVEEIPRAHCKPTGKLLQPANVKKIHDIIRCALNHAIKWNYLDQNIRNPASLATLPEMKKKRRKVWDIDVFKDALVHVDDPLLKLSMHIAFSCSARYGEIAALSWKDVIIDDHAIRNSNARIIINKELARVSIESLHALNEKDVIMKFPMQKPNCSTRLVLKTPKTESSNRTVWLPESLAMLLRQHKQEQDEMREFLGKDYNNYNLVLAQQNGNPVESRTIRKRLAHLCDDYDLEHVDFHSLRHLSTNYKLKMTKGDVKSVQGDTGHAEAEMVMEVYSRIIDEDRRHNAVSLENSFYADLGSPSNNFGANYTDILANSFSDEQALSNLFKSMSPEIKKKFLQEALQSM